jgi:hypothetical protein
MGTKSKIPRTIPRNAVSGNSLHAAELQRKT